MDDEYDLDDGDMTEKEIDDAISFYVLRYKEGPLTVSDVKRLLVLREYKRLIGYALHPQVSLWRPPNGPHVVLCADGVETSL